jgi:general stress protein YciG
MTQKHPPPQEVPSSNDAQDIEASLPPTPSKLHRGFAVMDPEQRRVVASRGGKAAHAIGRRHRFTSEEARAAGRKGGTKVSRDHEHMAELGPKSGLTRRSGPQRMMTAAPTTDADQTSSPAPSKVQP